MLSIFTRSVKWFFAICRNPFDSSIKNVNLMRKYSFDLICRHPEVEEGNSQMWSWCNRFFCHQLKCARPNVEKPFFTIRRNAFNTMGGLEYKCWWRSKCWKQINPKYTESQLKAIDEIPFLERERERWKWAEKKSNAFTIYLSAAIPLLSHSHCGNENHSIGTATAHKFLFAFLVFHYHIHFHCARRYASALNWHQEWICVCALQV